MSDVPTAQPTTRQVQSYADLLINRDDAYMAGAFAGHWVCRRHPMPTGYLAVALAGRGVLGLYSVDDAGLSRWACLDADDDHMGPALCLIANALPDPRSALLEQSRRGFHLWLFVEPSPWDQVRAWGTHLARNAGLESIEVFPKGPGFNGVRAPLTRHPKDGRRYRLIESDTGEIVTAPFDLLASRRRMIVPTVDVPGIERTPRVVTGRTDHRELVREVEAHTRLRHYGSERAIGRCPFHDDRHPSFGVIGGYWKCFAGCGSGGLNAFRARLRERGR